MLNENSTKTLVNILCKRSKGLTVVHFNARSLSISKLDFVKYVFDKSSVDLICITETWLNSYLSSSLFNLTDYNLLRNDRQDGRRGGGVAIYHKKSLSVDIVSQSDHGHLEYLNLSVKSHAIKVFVSCIYNPPNTDVQNVLNFKLFLDSLATFAMNYDFLMLCGDFNINLLNNGSASTDLVDLLQANGLSIVNKVMPTRFNRNCVPSLLDYFIVSDLNKVVLFDQINFVSDHDLIFCSFDLPFNSEVEPVFQTFYDYKHIDFASLYDDALQIDWEECFFVCSVDEKLSVFTNQIRGLMDRHLPLRTVRIDNPSCPWFTSSVKEAIKRRSKLHTIWKRNPTEANWARYKEARNSAIEITRNSKRHYCNKVLNVSLPPKRLWSNIRKFGICESKNNTCMLDPDDLNGFFTHNSSATNEPSLDSSTEANFVIDPVLSSFNFQPVSEDDVLLKIKKITSNAVGDDNLPIKFIKIILPYILRSLTHIINHCFTTSVFPSQWKTATVLPIAKRNHPSLLEDFRPISILPVLSKVIESLMSDQISQHLNDNKILNPFQSGFRKGHSCNTAMLKIVDDIRHSFDLNWVTLLCLLDFTKAFDSVDHELLCLKLKCYGFSDAVVNLIRSYLINRRQRVKIGDNFSNFAEITCGVPQGSILGPLLFSILINDMFSVCKNTQFHAYADDVQIYISRRPGLVEDLCVRLNEDLNNIKTWSINNKLKLNSKKCKVLPILNKNIYNSEFPDILIGNEKLQFLNKVSSLGFVLNSSLNCSNHVNSVVSKIHYVIRNLRMSSSFTPSSTKLKLVKQLIIPHINYFINVYPELDAVSYQKLLIAFNYATRYVFTLNWNDHVTEKRCQILGCDLKHYLSARNCIFLFNLIKNKTPEYLYDKLKPSLTNRFTGFITQRFSFLNTSRLFFVSSIKLWNSLPVRIKQIKNQSKFKNEIFSHFKNII